MYSLLAHSLKYSKRIFWYSLIEWSLFLGVLLAVAYNAGILIEGGAWTVLGSVTVGFIFLPMSQIRSVLLMTGETGSLEVSKVMPSIRLLLRFASVLITVPVGIAIVVALVIYGLGGFQDIALSEYRGDPFGLAQALFYQLPTNHYLQVYLVFLAILFIFTFSSNMVPFAAIAANLGNSKRSYDPFHGYGAYRYKAFTITMIVLVLNAVIIGVLISGTSAFFFFENIDSAGTLTSFKIPTAVWFFWGGIYVVWLFLQNTWFSACALLFSLYNEDVTANIQNQDQQMYGRQFQEEELRELRRLRMQK